MRKIIVLLVCCFFISVTVLFEVNSCTTFCLKEGNNIVFGRNFDFPAGAGHVIVNKRDIVKTAMIRSPEKPVQWVSKYGSVTFNQAGREFPYGGINEKGLVVEQMWLQDTKYPEIDSRSGLTELQWIQYQLDNFATVEEVLASNSVIRVSNMSLAPIHFLVCDRNGNVATIEYIDGRFEYHNGAELPYTALSNESYQKSLEYVNGFKNLNEIPEGSESFERFGRAANMVQKYNKQENIIDYSFKILDNVKQGEFTRWSIVYDISNMTVYYKTFNNQNIRKFNVSDFDFSCELPVLYADIYDNLEDVKAGFREWQFNSNRALIDNVFDNVRLFDVPKEFREASARYPESTSCKK